MITASRSVRSDLRPPIGPAAAAEIIQNDTDILIVVVRDVRGVHMDLRITKHASATGTGFDTSAAPADLFQQGRSRRLLTTGLLDGLAALMGDFFWQLGRGFPCFEKWRLFGKRHPPVARTKEQRTGSSQCKKPVPICLLTKVRG